MEVLGIDFGGSGIKGATIDTETGEFTNERFRIPTPQPATPNAVADVINEIVTHFNWKGKIGIGFPAAIRKGKILTASNIDKSWIGVQANQFLSQKTQCEVFVVNDADAAGIAEVHHGIGKDISGLVLLLTIGTGVGSVLFMNGQLIPNSELGHLKFKDKTIEKYAADSVRKRKELSWDEWGTRFNEVLKHFEKMFYPDVIIIGGGVSKKMEKFEHLITVTTPVKPAQLENNAGITGAAIFASIQ